MARLGKRYWGLVREAQLRRADILEAYQRIETPVSVALGSRPSRSPDGDRSLATWRTGAQRLAAAQPTIDISWLASDHATPSRYADPTRSQNSS